MPHLKLHLQSHQLGSAFLKRSLMVCINVQVWGVLVWSQLSYKLVTITCLSKGGKGRLEVKWLVLTHIVLALAFSHVWFPSPTLPSNTLNPMSTLNICRGVQEESTASRQSWWDHAKWQEPKLDSSSWGQSQVMWLFPIFPPCSLSSYLNWMPDCL